MLFAIVGNFMIAISAIVGKSLRLINDVLPDEIAGRI
jgi:hypothetical protein